MTMSAARIRGASTSRVSVNLLWCIPTKVGGSEEYLVRQLLGIAEIEPDMPVTLYVLPAFAEAHPELAATFDIQVASIDGASRFRRVIAEHFWLARRTRGSRLVHHGGGTVPARGAGPVVLTIHDLQYLTYPQYFGRIKRAYLNWAMPRSAARADVIAVPTEFVRQTVLDAYRVRADRVVVVPHGLEPSIGLHATDEATLRARYALGAGPIVVLPAMTHPHKGHQFLLNLMAQQWTDPSLRLVFIGGKGLADEAVEESITRLGLAHRVIRTGRVSSADRDGLIKMAHAMVFPSEYEGFGAPIIEAMAIGTPVICADRTCLPEVAGNAALVLPLELEAWAPALDTVRGKRAEMVEAGLLRAAQFTSAVSARALLVAYELASS
ncbi:MAG: glycosyltransferase family 1 protein [Actinomycetota bacterium]